MAELGEEGQPPQKKKYKVNVQESIDRVLDYIGLDDTPWRAIVVLWNTKTDPLGRNLVPSMYSVSSYLICYYFYRQGDQLLCRASITCRGRRR